MNKLTFASLGLAASVIASVALFNCNNDPMGNTPTDTADMAVGSTDMATGSGDMALTNPDLAGVAAPTKVTGFKQPTSAFWDAATSSWYVSNVGGATVTDPKTFSTNMTAFISKVPANLMNPNHAWYPNTATPRLNAPFGLRGGGGKLYASATSTSCGRSTWPTRRRWRLCKAQRWRRAVSRRWLAIRRL
ncbi:MAG: hypothetical protein U0787_07570 [Polyangia bacterium]